jgi:PBP1b-binding outer membrane lipoprotein LpoB
MSAKRLFSVLLMAVLLAGCGGPRAVRGLGVGTDKAAAAAGVGG